MLPTSAIIAIGQAPIPGGTPTMTVTEPGRPTPEQFLNLIRRQEQGRLKLYLGSSAGVGKTYAILREGNRLKKQGVDAAIGFVETHGRVETAEQVGDLPVIPPREIEYRGVSGPSGRWSTSSRPPT